MRIVGGINTLFATLKPLFEQFLNDVESVSSEQIEPALSELHDLRTRVMNFAKQNTDRPELAYIDSKHVSPIILSMETTLLFALGREQELEDSYMLDRWRMKHYWEKNQDDKKRHAEF